MTVKFDNRRGTWVKIMWLNVMYIGVVVVLTAVQSVRASDLTRTEYACEGAELKLACPSGSIRKFVGYEPLQMAAKNFLQLQKQLHNNSPNKFDCFFLAYWDWFIMILTQNCSGNCGVSKKLRCIWHLDLFKKEIFLH